MLDAEQVSHPIDAQPIADQLAAGLTHHEPGWRLPRRSALAKKYNVGLDEIDAAIGDLVQRSLVRRLPDGQVYRASPAADWLAVEGAGELGTRLDPMGNAIDRQTRQVSRREAPHDVAATLGWPADAPVHTIRSVWSADGDPVAVSTAYLLDRGELTALPVAAVSVEMSPPRSADGRALGLLPGQPVITVTARFDDSATRAPAGLAIVILKPELFRVAIDTGHTSTGHTS